MPSVSKRRPSAAISSSLKGVLIEPSAMMRSSTSKRSARSISGWCFLKKRL
jgi:hypothetical protein